ncbi:hypothetical protein IWW34DRAFT_894881 [Fusarium oxysporum f. sp. albedinis]|nr:hypothetical protein IWW34DRAFT_894881 [Fusarium oxysporum f. sp. albedinis]
MYSFSGFKLAIVAAILVLTFFIGPYDGNSPTDTSHYVSGAHNIHDVVVPILPDLDGIAHIVTEEVLSIDSIDIGTKQLIIIRHTVMKYLRQPHISGVVLVLGSSKLTFVTRFLEHTIALDDFNKSVCLTAALKPILARGAEGRGSILNVLFSGGRSLLGKIVDLGPERIHRPSNSPKTLQVRRGPGSDFDIAVKDVVEGAVLGVEDGYWPEPLVKGLGTLMNGSDLIVAAVSYGFSYNIRHRIDGVVQAGDWTDRGRMMLIPPFLLASIMSREEIPDFIATPYKEV